MRRTIQALAAVAAGALCLAALAQGEVVQKGTLSVSVIGKLSPTTLPRSGTAPIAVTLGGHISSTDFNGPPQLQEIKIEINRTGQLLRRGIPLCRMGHINPSTTREALAACGSSLIGEGRFSANVKLPEQSPFPSEGKVLAFNGRLRGQPAIFAHIYGTHPVPTSYVLPFLIRTAPKGTFGTILEASLPRVTGDWGYVTGVSMRLSRSFTFHGQKRSYLAAGCPAPKGFPGAVFRFMRTSFSFAGGTTLSATLTRKCKVG